MSTIKKVVVLGGTGAQGSAVVRGKPLNTFLPLLAVQESLTIRDGKYHVSVQTRNPEHRAAKELGQLPNVTFLVGHIESDELLREAMQGQDAVFFLANGFSIGEKAEIFWSIRAFEIARETGIKYFQFSNLDYGLKKGGYNPKFRCAHYDGKGRVAEWMQQQPLSPMKWAILTSGPYMEMMHFLWAPKFDEATSTYVFYAPLGEGAIPMIHLDDLGEYARWIFDHPDQSAGMDLEIATQHVHFDEVVRAFTNTTGKKAVYQDIPLKAWFDNIVTEEASSGYQVPKTEAGILTWRQSFAGWWNLWRHSGGADPVIGRDYQLLDKILPARVRSIEEWMQKVKYTGDRTAHVLKDREDEAGADRFIRK